MATLKETIIDKMDAEIMDWFYEVVKINFNTEMIQDSTDLRNILEENLSKFRLQILQAIKERLSKKSRRIKNNAEYTDPLGKNAVFTKPFASGYNTALQDITKIIDEAIIRKKLAEDYIKKYYSELEENEK